MTGKRITLILLLSLMPSLAQALGLGEITTRSHLGEPLLARIDIFSATVPEQDSLIVVLGDAAAFQRSGLTLTREHKQLQFKLINLQSESGSPYIEVKTTDPVREPILAFVVEARWQGGQMSRTYTILLDPPYYAAAEKRKARASKETQEITRPEPVTPPVETAALPPPAPVRQAAPAPSAVAAQAWNVAAGDTLHSIAGRVRPPGGATVDQTMIAIYQSNPEAFIHGNINNLKQGATLRVPTVEEIQALGSEEASRQVRQHHERWQAAATPPPAPETGQPGLRILAAESDDAGPGPSARAGTGEQGLAGIKKELALTTEAVETYRSENEDLQARLSAAEARIENLKQELQAGLAVEAPLAVAPEPAVETQQYGPVAAGETLWVIANRLRPDPSVSVNQMMLALLRTNPEAFINNNINLLKRGALLGVPPLETITALSKAEAAAEVKAHYTSWKMQR